MIDRIGFTLISAAIAITVIAFTRNKTAGLQTNLSIAAFPDGPYNTSHSRRTSASLFEQDLLDLDSVLISVADPLVIQAGETIRNSFNAQRKTVCKSMGLYQTRGVIQYAKKAVQTNGNVLYTLEIVFDDAAVFARVALLPNNVDPRFRVVVTIPSPCEGEIQQQLAVSSLVVNQINKQKLSWTASLNAVYEGVQIQQFGLGFNPPPDADRQAQLIALMASKTPPSSSKRAATAGVDVEQRRAAAAPLSDSAGATSESPIETPTPPHTSTMADPPDDRSHSLVVTVTASQRFFPPPAVADAQPADADAPAQYNATGTTAPVSPAATPQPAAGRRRAAAVRSVTALAGGLAAPAAFDARDIREGEIPCKAYTVLNQGGCGACYAFSSASAFSARLCRANPAASVSNVVVSPQSILDCASGCNGGDILSALGSLVGRPGVELWCDPFEGAKQACGSVCGAGNTYAAMAGSVRQVGGAGAHGVLQMQLELVRGGPGVVSFSAMSDIFAYAGGVYSPSASARTVSGHAVVLVGWGMDQGVPYWLCQNSWGPGWGEQGFFRIVRGADTCGIESSSGLVVAQPLAKPICPASACSAYAGAVTRRDCTCQCPFGRTGPTCKTCALNCRNGAARVAFCTRCECQMGTWGKECEGGYRLSSHASCALDAPTKITVTYAFTAAVPAPTQASFIGIYRVGEVGPFNFLASASVCGATYPTYSKAVNGGLCPASGTFQLSRPTVPGQYKIVVVPWNPMNELGLQGYYNLQDSNTIGLYTVLPSACSDKARAAAELTNDPATLLSRRLAAAAAQDRAQLAAMKARLDAAQPLRAALLAEPAPSLTITGLSAAAPLVWMGMPGRICFSIPPSANVNPKGLVLYVGNGASGSYYPNALGAGSAPMPVGPQGCSDFTVSRGVAVGPYTIALEDSAMGSPFAAVSFTADRAAVSIAAFTLSNTAISPTVAWSVPAARASVRDTVRVYNPLGAVVYWFYTSCNCQTAPGNVAAAAGKATFTLIKDASVKGSHTFKLHPGGAAAAAAVATDWIPWAKIGW